MSKGLGCWVNVHITKVYSFILQTPIAQASSSFSLWTARMMIFSKNCVTEKLLLTKEDVAEEELYNITSKTGNGIHTI